MIAASALLAAASPFGAPSARAVPVPNRTPASRPSASPSAQPSAPANALPIDSSLIFVLDDSISSLSSKKNDTVRVHLKDPLVIGSTSVAPAGAPAQIKIMDSRASEIGDVYGYVDIYFLPLRLPDGREVPLRAPTSHLTINVSSGHVSTVGIEDTIGDIFIPGHVLYHIFRKGRNFELGAGSEIRARTEATISITPKGAVAVTTPAPLLMEGAVTPHPAFSAEPFATALPSLDQHSRKSKSSPKPSPSPTASPTSAASPSPASSPE